jgi:benzoyl-CoA reductase/2-hydroxyglutaryl-CoA dehydratase subunit BcrC/BadD/HgdB
VCERYVTDAKKRSRRVAGGSVRRKRVLWLHLEPFYGNGLITMLEDFGADIITEEINTIPEAALDISRPWESMAERVLSQVWIGGIDRRLDNITRIVDDYRIDGVIHFSHWGCRQSNGAARLIRYRVASPGIPFLDLDGDCVDTGSSSGAAPSVSTAGCAPWST